MPHTITSKKRLLTRVRRVQGQANALAKALQEEQECAMILQQMAAIRGAVNGLIIEVLEGHVREHLGVARVPPKQRAEDVEQVVAVLRSYLR
jgi:DNA-binding FrmR family transcriptional regulator